MNIKLILFDVKESELVENLKSHVERVFGTEIMLSKRRQLPACRRRGDQYLAEDFIFPVNKEAESGEDYKLGVVEVDLYSSGLNFVFGVASPFKKSAVVSLFRLKTHDKKLYFERAKKEATHEIGHLFGLEHCRDTRCVMHFSNSILDTDYKSPFPCMRCNKKLSYFLSSHR
jgi:archaemetzincin